MTNIDLKPVSEMLVPMDFSQCSIGALQYAMRLAVASNARLHLLYVDDDPILNSDTTDPKFRDEHADKMSMKFVDLVDPGLRERFKMIMAVRFGTAYHEIEAYAEENGIELIVLGNVGRSGIADALLGSVAAHIIRHAACPVLSVKSNS